MDVDIMKIVEFPKFYRIYFIIYVRNIYLCIYKHIKSATGIV